MLNQHGDVEWHRTEFVSGVVFGVSDFSSVVSADVTSHNGVGAGGHRGVLPIGVTSNLRASLTEPVLHARTSRLFR